MPPNYKKSLFKFYSVVKKSDSSRIEKLVCYVYSLVKQGESSLEAIGAGLPAQTDQQSRVKQVKRFLQSKYTDCRLLFFPFIEALLAGTAQKRAALVLVIDGTVLRTAKNTLIEDAKCDRYALADLYVDSKIGHLLVENCGIGKQGKGCVNVLIWHEKGEADCRPKEPIYLLSNLEWAKNLSCN